MKKQTGVQLASIDEQKPLRQLQQINIEIASSSRPPPPNLPRSDLITGPREDYLKIGVPLYEASITCDWKTAKAIIDEYPYMELVRSSITENGETALHIAASAKGPKHVEDFVKNLMALMEKDDLELRNNNQNTALYLAIVAGNIRAVKIMVERNSSLLTIPGSNGTMMPLYTAALFGHKDVVKYLYNYSNMLRDDGWTSQNRGWLLLKCVENDLFDVALEILKTYPELGTGNVLGVLARKPDAFLEIKFNIISRTINRVSAFIGLKWASLEKEDNALQLLRIIWGTIAKKPKKDIDDILRGPTDVASMGNTNNKSYSSRILFVAAEMGNVTFIVELIRQYPDLIWKVNDNNQSIFHIAVKHRHEDIYNLLYEIGSMKDLITPLKDRNDNNMLHLVGQIAKQKRHEDVPVVALQMQRELLWFKEVEAMIPPSYRERKNKVGLTPYELFQKEHKDLLTQGEKWMKGIASQCMVVAALIATIVFAAAFTVPGGYDEASGRQNGIPIFHSKATFMAFVVTDAISLFASSTSIIMFLSILTSRYAERDFLESLPTKLMLGLATLFLSITAMIVAFSVSFFVLYHKGLLWMPIIISVFAVFSVLLYMVLQYGLFFDVIQSTYGSRYLFNPHKHVLYYKNPRV